MTQLYRPIIKQAAIIAWRFKFLWIFGFFATALSGAGNYEIIIQALQTMRGGGFSLIGLKLFFSNQAFEGITFSNIGSFLAKSPLDGLLIILTLLLALAIAIILIWVIVVSVAALIYSVGKLYKNEKVSFAEAFDNGAKNFWPVLGINFLAKLGVGIFLFTVSIPLFYLAANPSWLNVLLYLILFIIMVAASVIISFVSIFAITYVVLNKNRWWESIKYGYVLFKKNWLISIETGIIVLLINFLFGLASIAVILALSIPFVMLLSLFVTLSSSVGYVIVLALGLLALLVFIILASAFLSSFQFTVWTLLFLRIQKRAQPKIMRLAETFYKT